MFKTKHLYGGKGHQDPDTYLKTQELCLNAAQRLQQLFRLAHSGLPSSQGVVGHPSQIASSSKPPSNASAPRLQGHQ